ncbi:MAG: hypothetical protein WBC04_15745 [Candidatus Acidiferrales bacterium]
MLWLPFRPEPTPPEDGASVGQARSSFGGAWEKSLSGYWLGGRMGGTGAQAILPLSRLPHRWVFVAVGGLVLLLGVLVGLNVGGLRQRLFNRGSGEAETSGVATPAGPPHARRSVAVLGFKNLSGRPDEAWLSTALSEMLTTELAAGGKLRTIPGENVAQMKISLSLPDADSYGKETLSKIRKNLGSDHVVLGSYLALGTGDVRLDLKLEDTTSGEIVDSLTENGKEQKVSDLISRCGSSLRKKLGAGEVSATEAAAVKASLPSNPEAARLYSDGLAKLRTFDALAARDLLQKATSAEPNFGLGHAALAAAWTALGYDEKAKVEAKKAFDLSANLAPEDRLSIEGQYRQATKEWDKAIEIYTNLFQSFPDNLDFGLYLVTVEIAGGKYKDSLSTVEKLKKLPSPTGDDPRIDLAESRSAMYLADNEHSLLAATAAAEKARAQDARLLLAAARRLQCGGYQTLGQVANEKASCEEAKRLYTEANDLDGRASVLNAVATGLMLRSDLVGAKRTFEEAQSVFRTVGDKGGVGMTINNIAIILQTQGDLVGAKKMFGETEAISREIGDQGGVVTALMNTAVVEIGEGELTTETGSTAKALEIERQTGDKNQMVLTLANLSGMLALQGRLQQAEATVGEAQTVVAQTANKDQYAQVLDDAGEISFLRGDLASARKSFEESMKTAREVEDKSVASSAESDLARLLIEEDDLAGAETQARAARDEFRNEKDADNETLAASDLIQSLHLADAARILENATVQAAKHGFIEPQFEMQLHLGEIEMKSGQTVASRARLEALEKDATAKGFLLIARKAAAVLK